jgi:hypothetical protein
MSVTWPEQYALSSSTHVPNNILPALIYRDVLPVPVNPELSKRLCEGNGWEKRVSNWSRLACIHGCGTMSPYGRTKFTKPILGQRVPGRRISPFS